MRVFFPRKQAAYDKTLWDDLPKGTPKTLEQLQAGKGDWPEIIKERFKDRFVFDDIFLDAASFEVSELISLFEKEKGFKPFSYLEGRYRYSKIKPSPFRFFYFGVKDGGSGEGFDMDDDINFEDQMKCDFPPCKTMTKGNNGCGRWKNQIKPFRLAEKPVKIPVRDFFSFWAGPHLPDARIYGISSRAREIILQNNITGCEIQPILSHDGKSFSSIYQLTITGETQGAIPVMESLSDLKSCSVCGYTPILEPDMYIGSSITPDSFYSEKDLQICDRVLVEGRELRGFNLTPWLIASEKFIRLYKEFDLKGISFNPVVLLSEVRAAGLFDKTSFSILNNILK